MNLLTKFIVGILISGFLIAFGILVYAEIKKMMNQIRAKNPKKDIKKVENNSLSGAYCPTCGHKL